MFIVNDHSTAFDEKKVKELLGDQMYLKLVSYVITMNELPEDSLERFEVRKMYKNIVLDYGLPRSIWIKILHFYKLF